MGGHVGVVLVAVRIQACAKIAGTCTHGLAAARGAEFVYLSSHFVRALAGACQVLFFFFFLPGCRQSADRRQTAKTSEAVRSSLP